MYVVLYSWYVVSKASKGLVQVRISSSILNFDWLIYHEITAEATGISSLSP
jgi:hypothetical protein